MIHISILYGIYKTITVDEGLVKLCFMRDVLATIWGRVRFNGNSASLSRGESYRLICIDGLDNWNNLEIRAQTQLK